jgi:glycosyltransferase involved in cell wall biosynthesis
MPVLAPLKVSLIATVKDEAASIDGFLDGLLRQSRPPDEIVLVDGGSTDGTVAAIERAQGKAPVPVRLIQAPGTNISEGRNIAIDGAAHEAIAVTDAGTTPELDWLEKLVAPLELDPELAVSSGFFLPGGSGWRQRTLAIAITPQREEIDASKFLPSSRSVAFRRAWWSRVGGYPEWLRHCEDLVFDLALRRADAAFAFVPSPASTSTTRAGTVTPASGPGVTCFAMRPMRWAASCSGGGAARLPWAGCSPAGLATSANSSCG